MGKTSSASLALDAFGAIGVPRMDSRCCAALRLIGAGTFASSIDMTPPLLAGPCLASVVLTVPVSLEGHMACVKGVTMALVRGSNGSLGACMHRRRGTAAAMTPDPGALRAARAELQ